MRELTERGLPDNDFVEALDRDFERASRTAGNACRYSYRSPDYSRAIERLQLQYNEIPRSIPTNHCEIEEGYKQAINALRTVRQEAREIRNLFLDSKAAQYAALEETGKAHIVRRILRAETMSRVYRKIKFIRQRNQRGSLASIKVPRDPSVRETAAMKELPDNDANWRTIRIPEEIERKLLERNQQHFGQAEGTPFTKEPLSMQIKYDGTGIHAEAILQGTYDASGLEETTALFIKHLQMKSLHNLEGSITTKDIIGKLKRWPEKTTTSPSGMHLGHYHAMWRNTGCVGGEDDPEGQAIINAQMALQEAHTLLLQYALKHGYSYSRWQSVINVMLEKDPGNPRIHRLRVIHIYEADYNLILAVKWREALYHAEDSGLLNKGLYGSRPGRSAISPVSIEVMQHAIYQLSMKSGIKNVNGYIRGRIFSYKRFSGPRHRPRIWEFPNNMVLCVFNLVRRLG